MSKSNVRRDLLDVYKQHKETLLDTQMERCPAYGNVRGSVTICGKILFNNLSFLKIRDDFSSDLFSVD